MALIKCTECNKKFSEYASACPNCSCPTKIVKKNILIKKEEQYNNAINLIETYKTTKELYKAKDILNSLDGFNDSVNKIEKIEILLTYEEQKEKQKLYDSAINIISNYKNINDLYEAKEIFNSLNGFKDSINKIDEIENLSIFKKQKLYNSAINIISNYKSADDLYEAKEIFNSLNDFRDSSKKNEELEYLLNFETECQKMNIKQFAKIIVAILIFIVISLCFFLLIYETNKINEINANIKENERLETLTVVTKPKTIELSNGTAISTVDLKNIVEGCRWNDFSGVNCYFNSQKHKENEHCQFIIEKDVGYFYFQSKNKFIYFEKYYNAPNAKYCYKSKTYQKNHVEIINYEQEKYSKKYYKENDCTYLTKIEKEMDNFKNSISRDWFIVFDNTSYPVSYTTTDGNCKSEWIDELK